MCYFTCVCIKFNRVPEGIFKGWNFLYVMQMYPPYLQAPICRVQEKQPHISWLVIGYFGGALEDSIFVWTLQCLVCVKSGKIYYHTFHNLVLGFCHYRDKIWIWLSSPGPTLKKLAHIQLKRNKSWMCWNETTENHKFSCWMIVTQCLTFTQYLQRDG